MKQDVTIKGAAHSSIIHDSAEKHVTGRADYIDDLTEPAGTLHAFTGPIKKQDGSDWLADGATAPDGDLLGMNFYVEGIVGDIPQ